MDSPGERKEVVTDPNTPSANVISRVAFSYESMMYAAEWLIMHEKDEYQNEGTWNAHIDSFLVHSRRLHDVLLDDRQWDDDLVISDLLDDPPTIKLPVTSSYSKQMNKRVLHLTTQADPELVSWPVREIAHELGSAMDKVIEQMDLEDAPCRDRFVKARNGEPGFRKLVM
jgi:hypothetical protein